jgi:hypothetical protein
MEGTDWNDLSQDMDKEQTLVKMVINRFLKCGKFLN